MQTEEFSVLFLHETEPQESDEGAVLIEDGDNEIWIPKSLIKDFDNDYHQRDDIIEIEVATWFAEQEGMI